MPLKSGKLSAAEKEKRQGFIKGKAKSVIPNEMENDPVFFTKNIVNFYLELKQRGMLGTASRMVTNMKDMISGGMTRNPKSVLILTAPSSNIRGDTLVHLDWFLVYSFLLKQFVFRMNKTTITNGLLMQALNLEEQDLERFNKSGKYMIPVGGPQTTAEFINRIEKLANEFSKRTTIISRRIIDHEIEKALIKADVSHTALQSGNMNENLWRVQFSDESLKPLMIKTLWLPKDKKLDLTFNVASDGEYKTQFDKLFTQQERMRALPLNQVAKYVIWFVGAYENSAAELNQQPKIMNQQESTVKSFIKNSIFLSEELIPSSKGIGPEQLEKFKDKFLAVVADDDDKKYKIIKELEQLRDGTVKPGSKLEAARNKQYASWAPEDFQAMIDHLNSRSLPEEATDTIAEIVLDLAMMHPESDSTKQLLSALETKDFSSNNPVFKVITAHFPPSWKKDDYMDVVKKIIVKSEYENIE